MSLGKYGCKTTFDKEDYKNLKLRASRLQLQ
uniref:Uncharacterized protein n=1 Tax=Arundo donax TaxID=35708 RepID=A0A0A8YPN6_ARUDO